MKDTDDQAEYVSYGNRRNTGDVAMEERLGNLSIGNPVISDKYSPYNLSNLLTQVILLALPYLFLLLWPSKFVIKSYLVNIYLTKTLHL